MTPASTVDFATAARTLSREIRRRGLVAPSFRSPPRLVGVDRSIRRRADSTVVSVRLRGRPVTAVLADLIEGVVVANRLGPPEADRLRNALWSVLVPEVGVSADASRRGSADVPVGVRSRMATDVPVDVATDDPIDVPVDEVA